MSPHNGSRAKKRLHGGVLEELAPPPVVVDLSESELRAMSSRKLRRLNTSGTSAAASLQVEFIDLDACGEKQVNSQNGRKSKRLSGESSEMVEVAAIEFRKPIIAGEEYNGSSCGLCFSEVKLETMYVLDDCSHRFCKPCLSSYLAPKLASLPEASATMTDAFGHLRCATRSCGQQLSRRDLGSLTAPAALRGYDNWLCAKGGALDHLFREVQAGERTSCRRPKCKGKTIQPDRIQTAHLSEHPPLLTRPVRCGGGMAVRSLARIFHMPTAVEKAVLSRSVAERLRAEVGDHTVEAVCTSCSSYVCKACGPLTKVGSAPIPNSCANAQCYKVHACIVLLENAMEEPGTPSHAPRSTPPPTVRSQSMYPCYSQSPPAWAAGTGFGGNQEKCEDNVQQFKEGCEGARKTEASLDVKLGSALKSIAEILGARNDNELVPISSAFCGLLCTRQSLQTLLRRLVSNDSLIDICERKELYLNMLELLRGVGAREELLPILCTRSSGAGGVGADGKEYAMGGAVGEDSILDRLQRLQVQGNVMLQSAKNGLGEDDEILNADLGMVCALHDCVELLQNNVAYWRAVQESMPGESREETGVEEEDRNGDAAEQVGSGKKGRGGKKKSSVASVRKEAKEVAEVKKRVEQEAQVAAYKAALRPLQFCQVAIDQHYYKKDSKASGSAIDNSGIHHQKRMLRLSKEVGSLATCLPMEWGSSIYLRVAEDRMDLMRALIVGPEGTPYHNGMFFFDIYLPPDYPQVPPQVCFLTTGGGTVRFNPNLYPCGKVCLSLLGTWAGPSWVPGQSTLLQVLVSIQSLILVPDPYFNEPGFERQGRSCSSATKYNNDQRCNTLQYALLPALKNPPRLFEDVTRTHCKAKRINIQEQCKSWQKMVTGHHKQKMVAIVDEINAELDKL